MLLSVSLPRARSEPCPFEAAAPAAFVALWSTGFVVARIAAPQADLALFLTARFALAAIAFASVAILLRDRRPRGGQLALQLVIGGLMHGCYLVAGYAAIGQGLSVGVMA